MGCKRLIHQNEATKNVYIDDRRQERKRTRMIIYVRWFATHGQQELVIQTFMYSLHLARLWHYLLRTTKLFTRVAFYTCLVLVMRYSYAV